MLEKGTIVWVEWHGVLRKATVIRETPDALEVSFNVS